MQYRLELSITGTEHTPGVIKAVERITDSVSVSVERPERWEALAYALDVLERLSTSPDARGLQGRGGDAVKDADAQVELATRITEMLRPLIAEIAADPGGEWYNGAAESTMQRLYANIIREVTR